MILEGSDGPEYVGEFIGALKEFKESVRYLDLTLKKILDTVTFPPREEKIFVRTFMEKLGFPPMKEHLANYL